MIGFNNTFGWANKNGTGVSKPPAIADLKQWLVNYDDGFEYVDKIDPLQVALPTAAQVNVVAYDGTQSTDFGDVGQTQDPLIKATFMTTATIGNRTIISRRQSAGLEREWYLALANNNSLLFVAYDASDGFALYVVTLGALTCDAGTWYDVEAWYDRANTKLLLRAREFGADTWISDETTAIPDLTFSGSTELRMGAQGDVDSFLSPYVGAMSEVGLFDFITGNPIVVVGDAEGGTLTPYDRSGNGNHARESTGTNTTANGIGSVNLLGGFTDSLHRTDLDIVILSGQSNMSGKTIADPPSPYDKGYDSIFFFDGQTGENEVGKMGLTTVHQYKPTKTWGPEIAGASAFQDAGRSICFIKVSKGGSSLANDWKKGGTGLYELLESTVSDVTSQLVGLGFTPTVREFWWMQGENDGGTSANASAYLTNLQTFWTDLTTDGVVSASTMFRAGTVGVVEYKDTINEALSTFITAEGGTLIDTSGYGLSDDIHYDAAGQILFGQSLSSDYLAEGYPEQTGEFISVGRIPALLDGSASADGNPITNVGSATDPCVHNGFEGALRESDTYFSDNAPNRWHDGVSFLDVYWSDIIAHSNGTDNSFQKTDEKNGNCRLTELGQYDFDKDWTPTEWIKAGNYWAVCDSFADPLVPREVTSGGIGPDGTWRSDINGNIIFVLPE